MSDSRPIRRASSSPELRERLAPILQRILVPTGSTDHPRGVPCGAVRDVPDALADPRSWRGT